MCAYRVNVRVKGPSCRLGAHYWTLAACLSRIPPPHIVEDSIALHRLTS